MKQQNELAKSTSDKIRLLNLYMKVCYFALAAWVFISTMGKFTERLSQYNTNTLHIALNSVSYWLILATVVAPILILSVAIGYIYRLRVKSSGKSATLLAIAMTILIFMISSFCFFILGFIFSPMNL